MHQVFADPVPGSPADSNFLRYVPSFFKNPADQKSDFSKNPERVGKPGGQDHRGYPPLAKSMLLYRANKHNLPEKELKNED
jgi:hypothetical protein